MSWLTEKQNNNAVLHIAYVLLWCSLISMERGQEVKGSCCPVWAAYRASLFEFSPLRQHMLIAWILLSDTLAKENAYFCHAVPGESGSNMLHV